jgi:hypothetical protein
LIDRSLGGVGLLLSQPVEPRTIWRLELANGSAPPVRVEVRYCRLHRGRWRVGWQFVNSPAPAGA